MPLPIVPAALAAVTGVTLGITRNESKGRRKKRKSLIENRADFKMKMKRKRINIMGVINSGGK